MNNNEICYTTTDGSPIEIKGDAFNVNIVSNIYKNGKGVILCDGDIAHINEQAFCGCNKLANVVLPDTVATIGAEAFMGCSRLESLFIPDQVTKIGDSAFADCPALICLSVPVVVELDGVVDDDCQVKIITRAESEPLAEKCLCSTDADLSVQSAVYATIDNNKRLTIDYITESDASASRNIERRVKLDARDTVKVAAYYHIKAESLPQFIFNRCGVAYATTPQVVDSVFKQSLDIILDAGVSCNFS